MAIFLIPYLVDYINNDIYEMLVFMVGVFITYKLLKSVTNNI